MRVGVTPSSEVHAHFALLDALEEAFPVTFEGRDPGSHDGLDGLVAFVAPSLTALRDYEDAAPLTCPRLIAFAGTREGEGSSGKVELADSTPVARALRGRALWDESVCALTSDLERLDTGSILATRRGRPVWWCRGNGADIEHLSAFPPPELSDGESLRDYLCAGRFMGLVPLVHLLRQVCADLQWSESPLRASFVIDDPNLHWSSYGYLRYPEMLAHAIEHGYHVGLAMVPLDGWMANRRAAALIRDNPTALSLLIHGNDHRAGELRRLIDDREAESVLAQALRRTARFERRAAVPVQRVMVPPHEACSRAALRAMFRLGFDGACIARRYPWSEQEPPPLPPPWPLSKWYPADQIGGGLPILPRYLIDRPREDLVFRALLGQPLIVFGHHWDFADGLEPFADAASFINGLGDVRWGSLGWIAERNFLRRREGDTLIVQMHTRRANVEIPASIDFLQVVAPGAWDDRSGRCLTCAAAQVPIIHRRTGWASAAVRVQPETTVELVLTADRPLDAASVPSAGIAAWPTFRRGLVEARDRLQPVTGKLGLGNR